MGICLWSWGGLLYSTPTWVWNVDPNWLCFVQDPERKAWTMGIEIEARKQWVWASINKNGNTPPLFRSPRLTRPCFGPKMKTAIRSTWCSTNVVGGSSFLEEGISKFFFLGGGDSLLNMYILYIFQGRMLTCAMTFFHFWWPQTPGPVRPRLVGRAGDVCHDAGQHWCCVVGSQNQRWMPQFPLSSGCLSWALARLSWARLFKRFNSSHRVPCVVQNARARLKLRVFFQQLCYMEVS